MLHHATMLHQVTVLVALAWVLAAVGTGGFLTGAAVLAHCDTVSARVRRW